MAAVINGLVIPPHTVEKKTNAGTCLRLIYYCAATHVHTLLWHSLALHTDVMCFSFNTFHFFYLPLRKPNHEDAELECALTLWETLCIETQTKDDLSPLS